MQVVKKIALNGNVVNLGRGCSSGGEIYSTEEQIIGTWIDGKPLYQKTWFAVTPSKANTWTDAGCVIDDLDYMVSFDAVMKTTVGSFVKVPYLESSTNYVLLSYWYGNQGVYGFRMFQNHNSGASMFGGADVYITAKYTKTTDEALFTLPTDANTVQIQTLDVHSDSGEEVTE